MTVQFSATHPSSRRITALCDDSIDVGTDVGLRLALASPSYQPGRRGSQPWEAVGLELLARARRDSRRYPRHASEFVGGYVVAALEALTDRPGAIRAARSPWAVLDTIGRRAGMRAVGEAVTGGLVARDPATHRVRLSVVPKVVSLDVLADSACSSVPGDRRWPH